MRSFMFLLAFFFCLAFNVRALQLHSAGSLAQYHAAGDKLADGLTDKVSEHYESFLDNVADKMYEKLGTQLDNPHVGSKMLVLLENHAELLDPALYDQKNLALIQTLFFSKLKEKFLQSKVGKKLSEWGKKIKDKLKDLYKKHGAKLKVVFKILLKSFVLPLAVKFIRTHLPKWRKAIIDATAKVKESTRVVLVKVIDRLFTRINEKLESVAKKYNISSSAENEAAKKLMDTEKSVEKLEKAENAAKKEEKQLLQKQKSAMSDSTTDSSH